MDIKSQILMWKISFELWRLGNLNNRWSKFYTAIEKYYSVKKSNKINKCCIIMIVLIAFFLFTSFELMFGLIFN